MTIYSEDPHDNWQVATLRPAKDHTGRSQFWLITFAALTVFWAAVVMVLHAVI